MGGKKAGRNGLRTRTEKERSVYGMEGKREGESTGCHSLPVTVS